MTLDNMCFDQIFNSVYDDLEEASDGYIDRLLEHKGILVRYCDGEYRKKIKRIGKVKGFSPSECDQLEKKGSFYLDGNSNGIAFLVYDLRRFLMEQSAYKKASEARRRDSSHGGTSDEVKSYLSLY